MEKDCLEEVPLRSQNDVDTCVPTDTWKRCHLQIHSLHPPHFYQLQKGPFLYPQLFLGHLEELR